MDQTFINRINNCLKGRSIFLIGMMGSGKSKTGPKLAELLKYKFIDMDQFIEKVAKKSINQIFTEDGEKIFREIEARCLKEIIQVPALIVSTGGGIITQKENWGILRQGIIVWLDLKESIAIERLKKDINQRPLLEGKDINNLYRDILNSRKELYEQADIRIKVANHTISEVSQTIISAIDQKIST